MNEHNAWRWHAIIFGGSLVFSMLVTLGMLGLWAWLLRRGRVLFGVTGLEWKSVPDSGCQ